GIRDTWGPYGNADMVERAMFIGLRNNFRRDDEVELGLQVCTTGGAAVMEIADYGLGEGKIADLVIMPGQSLTDIVVTRSPKRRVIKRGRIVARDGVSVRTAP
ncbi:amidohydrolase family protein, partial [Bosea sp. CER48]|uniref:amidohydrolase family protein n=1 Tax=Bosea sp. CER48 TaxID=3377035 RepID=UPI003801116A